ncbi:Putative folyl-polyglutamate synthetase [Paucilactobacillus oligofermentans DSM 15707 = LMG 22743]|nr:folylpolyglutamate synthase/dihydrofolate synthase family protein [Paucilactobacillus oligofermentans]CUS26583.1 Putative folyl-polyglutamate synthetase [Paucilactobacillus oligofermentans DSM 15707 = LMG 22743]
MINNYEAALSFIHGRQQFKKIPTLDRMRRLMAKLENPQDKLKMIHVTGTNGKGSTVAFLASLMMEQGLTVGTFTSPFITRFNERISFNKLPIDDNELLELVKQIEPIISEMDETDVDGGPTEFEIVTALMFMYFSHTSPDVVIVEVGIGGTYDSTNIITPMLSIITTVGLDHMKILGNTITEIANQKAGIIKPEVPVILGEVSSEAQNEIARVAAVNHTIVHLWRRDYQAIDFKKTSIYPQFKFNNHDIRIDIELSMVGEFQIQNAAVAIEAYLIFCQLEQISPNKVAIKKAMKVTQWPGRMELVNQQPAIFIDGAHNVPAIEALIETINADFSTQQVYLIVAILADKQVNTMIDMLAKLSNVTIVLTSFTGPHINRPAAKIDQIQINNDKVLRTKSWQEGLIQVTQKMSVDDVLIFTGSLYFISEVRSYFR